jgi:hypothetical protein
LSSQNTGIETKQSLQTYVVFSSWTVERQPAIYGFFYLPM